MTRKILAAGLLSMTLALMAGCGAAPNTGDSSETKLPAQAGTLQPAQGQPAQGQPAQGQPAQGQPAQGQPAQAQPAQAQPAQVQPAQAPPAQAQPAQVQPVQVQPVQAQPATGRTEYQIVSAESIASYSVHEKFLDVSVNGTAVGKTSGITGALVLDGGKLQPSTVKVDLQVLKSDKSQRDKRLKTQGIEINKYPTAEFAITGAEGAAPTLADGQEVAFQLAGKMTIHGTEKPVVWDMKGTLQGGSLHLTGVIKFKMGEFNIKPPSILNLISVDDNVELNVDLTAKKS